MSYYNRDKEDFICFLWNEWFIPYFSSLDFMVTSHAFALPIPNATFRQVINNIIVVIVWIRTPCSAIAHPKAKVVEVKEKMSGTQVGQPEINKAA